MPRGRGRLRVIIGSLLAGLVFLGAALGGALYWRWQGRPTPPPAPLHEVQVSGPVGLPMRDGKRLATDLYRPQGAGKRLPAILIRTPYDKKGKLNEGSDARIFAGQGYVVAVQDVRGRYGSEGTFRLSSRQEAEDGHDTLSWMAKQPWSNGRIGTYGCSYSSEVQYLLAALRHPNHAAAIAQSGSAWGGGGVRLDGFSRAGVLELAAAFGWFRERGSKVFPVPELPAIDYLKALAYLPVAEMMRKYGGPPSDFEAFASHPPADPLWEYLGEITGDERFDTPTIHVNSWYDITPTSTLALFNLMQNNSVSRRARENQYLLMSPAAHCDSEWLGGRAAIGARRVGDPRFDYYGLYLRFFDRWLKGAKSGVEDEPRVQLYVMGKDRWRAESEWPLARARQRRYYLHSGGRANTRHGDGRLSSDAPGDEPADSFDYDPHDPVRSRGVTCCISGLDDEPGAYDQSRIEQRKDVLVYTTPPLADGVEVTGPLEVVLHVSSSAPDTDFTAKLVDVAPDGIAYNVQEGILRARYREGLDRERWLKPGQVVKLRIDLGATSNFFKPGHRVRLEISSSSFPRWERNLNTGGKNFDEARGRTARNTVHHSARHPSYLVLPVVPE